MRALSTVLVLAVLSTSATGCALFGKKEGSSEPHRFALFKKKESSSNPPPPKFPDPIVTPPGTPAPAPPTPTAQGPSAAEVALLAGRVVDAYNRPATNTYVQLVQLDSAKDGGSPVDVAASADGYFTIPNLKTGGQYKLIARTRQGEKMLAGIAIRQAPDVHVVIQVKEEFAGGSIPPLPAVPDKREEKPAATSSLDGSAPPVAVWSSAPVGNGAPTLSTPTPVDLPAKLTVPSPNAAAPNPISPGFASTPSHAWPPPLQINGGPKNSPTPARPFTAPQPPPLPSPGDAQGNLAPLVPSSVVVAGTVQILALKDVDDQAWNFHKDRRGKLVLLDFWTRDCVPCQKTMPILTQVQSKFGPQGLEVVGVFLDTGTLREQSERAKKICYQLQTNYRQVLAQDDKTRLREQFNLQAYPSLILVDDTGRILWRHVGAPDAATLENVLQKHVASRAF
jgi:thiol-disulfide isomerase/thioredoxin